MSKMSEMDWLVQETLDFIEQGNRVDEAIDAVVLTNDLTQREKHSIIHFLAKRGFKQ